MKTTIKTVCLPSLRRVGYIKTACAGGCILAGFILCTTHLRAQTQFEAPDFTAPSESPQPTGWRKLLLLALAGAANNSAGMVGDWNIQGGVLTFEANGRVEISYNNGASNIGSYSVGNGLVTFYWSRIMSVPVSVQWQCGYSLAGRVLTLRCAPPGPSMRLWR